MPTPTVSTVYIGNSTDQTLYGGKNETVKCSDKKFDELVCMTQEDFNTLVSNSVK